MIEKLNLGALRGILFEVIIDGLIKYCTLGSLSSLLQTSPTSSCSSKWPQIQPYFSHKSARDNISSLFPCTYHHLLQVFLSCQN